MKLSQLKTRDAVTFRQQVTNHVTTAMAELTLEGGIVLAKPVDGGPSKLIPLSNVIEGTVLVEEKKK